MILKLTFERECEYVYYKTPLEDKSFSHTNFRHNANDLGQQRLMPMMQTIINNLILLPQIKDQKSRHRIKTTK